MGSGQDAGRSEVVDVFANAETVDTGQGTDDRVDMNSASEGDGRAMTHEDGGANEGGSDVDDGAGRGNARPARAARGARGNANQVDDDSGYSARVQKRIQRERTLVNRERTLREQVQRELTEERAARQAQDERIARLERQHTEVAGNAGVKELEAQVAALRPQLAAAMEAGETAKALDLQEKIGDLKAKIEVMKYDLAQQQRRTETTTSTTTKTTTTPVAVIDDPRVASLVDQFTKANRHWWNRTANKDARADAITIDKEILGEISRGELDFEPYTDEHFEEVARRLHETYPDLEIQDLEGQPYNFDAEGDEEEEQMNDTRGRNGGNPRQNGNGQRQGGSAPVRGMGQNGRKAPNEQELARQGKVTLNEDDFATMRLFKMDPNNPNDKKYFAREKMRSILSGARQAGGSR